MANYTITIREYLQSNFPDKHYFHDEDDTPDMVELANSVMAVIPEYALNTIKEEYRQAFGLMFVLHYFNDEIGFQTPRLFKTALIGKFVQYHDYINSTLDLVKDGLFTSKMTTTNDSTSNGKSHNTSNGTSNTMSDSGTTTQHVENSNSNTNTNTSTGDSNSGLSTTSVTTPTGTTTTETSNKAMTTTHGAHSDSHWNQFSDTPQNGLDAVRSGTYLTNATYTEDNVGGSTDSTTGGGSTTTTSHQNEKVTTTTDQDFNKSHTHNTETTKDVGSGTSTTDVKNNQERKGETNTTTTNTGDATSENKSKGTSETMTYSYDSLTGTIPLIDFVWTLFDDLFMQIHDEFYF